MSDLYQSVQEPSLNREEMQHLIDAITTNKTEFFREPKQWEFLKNILWPQFQREKAAQNDLTLRIWSSASSTGEEPYSLAMHALSHLDQPKRWKIQILASDINEQVLAKGRLGIYEENRMVGVPLEYRKKFFLQVPGGMQVRPDVRQMISFRNVNLKGNFPRFVRPLDMIFCRNVIIYFDKETQAELMKRFHGCIRKGGYLFLGHSESLNGICDLYKFVSASIYRKEG